MHVAWERLDKNWGPFLVSNIVNIPKMVTLSWIKLSAAAVLDVFAFKEALFSYGSQKFIITFN